MYAVTKKDHDRIELVAMENDIATQLGEKHLCFYKQEPFTDDEIVDLAADFGAPVDIETLNEVVEFDLYAIPEELGVPSNGVIVTSADMRKVEMYFEIQITRGTVKSEKMIKLFRVRQKS